MFFSGEITIANFMFDLVRLILGSLPVAAAALKTSEGSDFVDLGSGSSPEKSTLQLSSLIRLILWGFAASSAEDQRGVILQH